MVESAGTWVIDGEPPPAEAAAAAAKLGMNIDSHRTRMIHEQMLQNFDLIIVMERGQMEAIGVEFPMAGPRVHLLTEMSDDVPGDIPDPHSAPLETNEILREVCNLVQKGFSRIKQLAENMTGIPR